MDHERPAPRSIRGGPVMALVMWALVMFFVVGALGFNAKARVLPLTFGVPGLVLATLLVVREWRRPPPHAHPQESRETATDRRQFVIFGWLAFLVALYFIIGFAWTTILFMLAFLRLYARESWRLTLWLTAGTYLVLYVIFSAVLRVDVYRGWLWYWF